jgi:hypothetical protein
VRRETPKKFGAFHVSTNEMKSGFMTIYGAAYLLSLIVAMVITIQMQQTLENLVRHPT